MDRKKIEIWPGPMEGAALEPFVRAVGSLGLVDRWMTPFLRVSGTCPKQKKIARFLVPYLESGLPVTVQIMGTQEDVLAETAVGCLEAGAAGIDLNCGCPSKRVVSAGAGGGSLKDPVRLAAAVAAIRRAVGAHTPFSVKMRSGVSSPEEMLEIIPRLAEAGADRFFVHYRTVREQYLAVPGREERLTRAVLAAAPLPVIANGDIASVGDGLKLAETTGVAGLMIARALLRDPWLILRFADPAVPSPAAGRRLFWEKLEAFHVRGGNKLELARMMWGKNSPQFRELVKKSELVGQRKEESAGD